MKKTIQQKISNIIFRWSISKYPRKSEMQVAKEINKSIIKSLPEELPSPTCHISHKELVDGYNECLLRVKRMFL